MLLTRRHKEILILFFSSLILFIWGLRSQEIVGFESRFYLFALEMWRHGPSWFPTTYHQPYPDYPATSTFLIYLFANFFGGLNKLIAVVPTACAAAFTLTLTYLIGALHNKRFGFFAVCFLLLTVAFLQSARTLALDMYPTMMTTFCFYLIYSADIDRKPQRAWWVFPLFFAGFAFRGPIGFIVPAAVVSIYYLLDRNFKRFFIFSFLACILLIVCSATLLGVAYHVGGHAFVQEVLRTEVLGRITDQHSPPVYFYFIDGIKNYAISFPIAFLVLLGMIYYYIKGVPLPFESRFLLKLLGWIFIILIGMSIPGDKKTRYVLSVAPALALMAAYLFSIRHKQKYFIYLRATFLKIFLFFPLIYLLAAMLLYWYENKHGFNFKIYYLNIITFFIMMQMLAFFVARFYSNQFYQKDLLLGLLAAFSFIAAYIAVINPVELYVDGTRDFVVQIEEKRLQNHAQLVFYKENPDGLPIKYLVNMAKEEQPVFINGLQDLIQFHRPAFFVTSQSYYKDIPNSISSQFRMIAENKIGHTPVVVFTKGTSHDE